MWPRTFCPLSLQAHLLTLVADNTVYNLAKGPFKTKENMQHQNTLPYNPTTNEYRIVRQRNRIKCAQETLKLGI